MENFKLFHSQSRELQIYTDIEEAKREIWKRWNDAVLRKKIEEYLGEVPVVFRNEPRAVLDRTVISPNNELSYFIDFARQFNLKHLGWEYQDDKFCSKNADKLGLAKMAFYHKRNKKGEAIFSYRTIMDCALADGKRFSQIKTLWGENLIDFHHRILDMEAPEIEIVDGSLWFRSNGKFAANYYQYFLALFIRNGILFENFVTSGYEAEFTNEVMYPSFRKVEKLFGLKPLIVPLAPSEKASDMYWRCYPHHIEEEVKRCLARNNGNGSREK